MSNNLDFRDPWLVAVWPGMGSVALAAGYYLMSKLGMFLFAEYSSRDLFDVDHVMVKGGLILPTQLPRSRFFGWRNPDGPPDLILFLGEAQPGHAKTKFCDHLIDFAVERKVQHIMTFAAMATDMHPAQESGVLGASTTAAGVDELKKSDLILMKEGHISGLNGLLLGIAGERGISGTCLLGEMPQVFAQLPYPRASLAVLRAFASLVRLSIDLNELVEHTKAVDERLHVIYAQIEQALEERAARQDEEAVNQADMENLRASLDDEGLGPEDEQRLEELFAEAEQNRSKAFELKSELDRLGVFKQFENRFLDLFKNKD